MAKCDGKNCNNDTSKSYGGTCWNCHADFCYDCWWGQHRYRCPHCGKGPKPDK